MEETLIIISASSLTKLFQGYGNAVHIVEAHGRTPEKRKSEHEHGTGDNRCVWEN